MTSLNSFGSKMTLNVEGRELTYYSLRANALATLGVDRLPYSIKVLWRTSFVTKTASR